MSFTIPSGIFTKYAEYADAMLATSGFGVVCQLVYVSKIQVMSNDTPAFKQRKVMNLQNQSPNYGMGRGDDDFKITKTTENITLRVYWSKKDFKKFGNFDLPDGSIMTIGNYSDLKNIERASFLVINTSQTNGHDWRFEKAAEPTIHGLDDNYLMCYWKRV